MYLIEWILSAVRCVCVTAVTLTLITSLYKHQSSWCVSSLAVMLLWLSSSPLWIMLLLELLCCFQCWSLEGPVTCKEVGVLESSVNKCELEWKCKSVLVCSFHLMQRCNTGDEIRGRSESNTCSLSRTSITVWKNWRADVSHVVETRHWHKREIKDTPSGVQDTPAAPKVRGGPGLLGGPVTGHSKRQCFQTLQKTQDVSANIVQWSGLNILRQPHRNWSGYFYA